MIDPAEVDVEALYAEVRIKAPTDESMMCRIELRDVAAGRVVAVGEIPVDFIDLLKRPGQQTFVNIMPTHQWLAIIEHEYGPRRRVRDNPQA